MRKSALPSKRGPTIPLRANRFCMLLEAASQADQNGFAAVETSERFCLHLSGLDEIVCLTDFGMHHEEDMFSRCLLSMLLGPAPSRTARASS